MPSAVAVRGGVAPATGALPAGWFVNPIAEGADPHVVRDGTSYLWCFSDGDQAVSVSRSDRLDAIGERRIVWRAPAHGPCSAQIWAPELHHLDGRWHIYLAGSDGDNRTHRAFVLVADTTDPQGTYTLHGPLATGDRDDVDRWAIDMTVLEHRGQRYAVWSGWPGPEEVAQHLYLAPMASPTRLGGPRVLISDSADLAWERVPAAIGHPVSINEAPQVVHRQGRTFVLFSASSALSTSYAMGVLELVGVDPAKPTSWLKHPVPVLGPTHATPGVGHGLVVADDSGAQWLVFHAKVAADVSFRRAVHLQPMAWEADGLPAPGSPVARGVPLPAPAAAVGASAAKAPVGGWVSGARLAALADHYGHHQLARVDGAALRLGEIPEEPVNAYRSGEKLVVRGLDLTDVEVTLHAQRASGAGPVGVLLRTTAAAVGHDAFRGYFLGYDAGNDRLQISRHDGAGAVLLAQRLVARRPRRSGRSWRLVARAHGSALHVWVDHAPGAVLAVTDAMFDRGAVGVRVAGAAVDVAGLRIDAPSPVHDP